MPEQEPAIGGEPRLKKALGPVMLWGLGVGYVISGEYFGWNLGLPLGGTFGMLFAFALATLMYVTFVFSYTEMACAIPLAGGVFIYGVRGLGLRGGYLGGIAQVVEFVFAPPAIAMAIAAYVSRWFPGLGHTAIALGAYILFTALNIWGIRQAALFELGVTVLAVAELLLFTGLTAPHFQLRNLTTNAWPHGWAGALACFPFAIWFYLAIEGVANAAEEARDPARDVKLGFGAAMLTLVVLACFVFFAAIGVGGWERIVYEPGDVAVDGGTVVVAAGARTSDSPLPLALGQIVPPSSPFYHLLIGIGLLGLIASFNGILLAAGRALFEMGRVGFLPHALGRVHPKTRTPVNALVANMILGMIFILFLDTGKLIMMAAFGAVTLYIVSMLALFGLRRKKPGLPRPYRTPFYPWTPRIALAIAAFALLTMTYFNHDSSRWGLNSIPAWYAGLIALSLVYYRLFVEGRLTQEDIEHFERI